MAYFPISPTQSLLEIIRERLRRLAMSDWLKLGIVMIGYGILTWSMVQQHEYRLDKIETTLETHLTKHEEQYETIQKTLMDLKLEVARLPR
jgi:hypothetical protein